MANFSDIIGIHVVDTQREFLQPPPLFFFLTRVIQKTSIPSTEKCDMFILDAGLEFKFWSLLSKEMHLKKKPLKNKMKIKVE